MESPVGDRLQFDRSPGFGVRERPLKTGKSSWAVEFRPKWSKEIKETWLGKIEKIWVGGLKTREEANKACDAAHHFVGLPTQHYTYPSGHFGEIGELPQDEDALKDRVKSYATKYAELPLPIIAATPPTAVASEYSAPQLDYLALQARAFDYASFSVFFFVFLDKRNSSIHCQKSIQHLEHQCWLGVSYHVCKPLAHEIQVESPFPLELGG
jgi:hypothetical protein